MHGCHPLLASSIAAPKARTSPLSSAGWQYRHRAAPPLLADIHQVCIPRHCFTTGRKMAHQSVKWNKKWSNLHGPSCKHQQKNAQTCLKHDFPLNQVDIRCTGGKAQRSPGFRVIQFSLRARKCASLFYPCSLLIQQHFHVCELFAHPSCNINPCVWVHLHSR